MQCNDRKKEKKLSFLFAWQAPNLIGYLGVLLLAVFASLLFGFIKPRQVPELS